MAEVVARSTQLPDRRRPARRWPSYLRALPRRATPDVGGRRRRAAASTAPRGAKLYDDHCAACHGEQGEGVAGAYPALAGNRAVTIAPPANLVHIVLRGGFPPTTRRNPRPYGMPPFATVLSDQDVADVLSYLRASWGHRAPSVSTLEVSRYRGAAPR